MFLLIERKETEQKMPNGKVGKEDDLKPEKKKKVKPDGSKKKKKQRGKTVSEVISEVRDASEESDLDEEEGDFWMPPKGERWDHDDGGDRWGSDSESGPENDDADGEGMYPSLNLKEPAERML